MSDPGASDADASGVGGSADVGVRAASVRATGSGNTRVRDAGVGGMGVSGTGASVTGMSGTGEGGTGEGGRGVSGTGEGGTGAGGTEAGGAGASGAGRQEAGDKTVVSPNFGPSPVFDKMATNRVAFFTIVRKEIRRFARIWVQTIVPPAVNAVLYMLIFGGLIGSRISEMDGVSYMDFIVPGIIMMAIIVNSYANVVSSFYGTKFQHVIEEMLVSPISNVTILAGYITGGVARGIAVGALVACVALVFSDIRPEHPFITIAIAILTSIMFALGGLINAVFAKSFDDISIVPNFVLTPLTYLGGIFYSIHMLPEFWQKASLLNPVLYMINGFRYGILGISDIPLWQSFAVILVFIGVLGTIAMVLLERGVGIKQ